MTIEEIRKLYSQVDRIEIRPDDHTLSVIKGVVIPMKDLVKAHRHYWGDHRFLDFLSSANYFRFSENDLDQLTKITRKKVVLSLDG